MNLETVYVFTDGSCILNPGKGGWSWIEYSYDPDKKISLLTPQINFFDYGGTGDSLSTNNKMEVYALIEYLRNALYKKIIIIHSDSQYLLKSLIEGGIEGELVLSKTNEVKYTGWMREWKMKNFEGVKNVDLWDELDGLIFIHLKKGSILKFKYVKGHSTSVGNNEADRLARKGSEM